MVDFWNDALINSDVGVGEPAKSIESSAKLDLLQTVLRSNVDGEKDDDDFPYFTTSLNLIDDDAVFVDDTETDVCNSAERTPPPLPPPAATRRQSRGRRRRESAIATEDGDLSSSSSAANSTCDDDDEDSPDNCTTFMKEFVAKLFRNSSKISLEEKRRFGELCRDERGRMWFCRGVSAQRANSRRVDESTFYSLVQFFAICLFECAEADDYVPAKTLMNMCFTYFHVQAGGRKEFLYLYLREQPIWQSLRFWNAAFFDAVQCERSNRPLATRHNCSPEEVSDEQQFQENITFGQLGSFTCNMHAFGLSRDMCLEFLRKQSIIANLGTNQVKMLRENVMRMYC